jgi:hypothetical protein
MQEKSTHPLLTGLVVYIFVQVILLFVAFIWIPDSVGELKKLIIAAPIVMLLLSIPIFIVIIARLYKQYWKWGNVIQVATVWIRHGKVYIPVVAVAKPGQFVDISPVYVSSLQKEDVLENLKNVLMHGNPPNPTRIEDYSEDPVMQAMEIRNRGDVDVGFIIKWTSRQIILEVIKKGQSIHRDFLAQNTIDESMRLDEIVVMILDHVKKHGEV